MKFDGILFRRTEKVCLIPIPNPDPSISQYAVFGRIIPRGKDIPAEAHRIPGLSWAPYGAPAIPVFATVIPCDSYSRTNMMYGQDGKAYLAMDGACFFAPIKKKGLSREQLLAKLPPATRVKFYTLRRKHNGDHLIIESEGSGFGFCVGKGLTWQAAYDDYLRGLTAPKTQLTQHEVP